MGKFRQFVKDSPVKREIEKLLPEILKLVQKEYDAWEQDSEGNDIELGSGGICDRIASQVGFVLASNGFDVADGGQDGDDHAYVLAGKNGEAFAIDIHPNIYETGSGYSWKKKPGVIFKSEHVDIQETNPEFLGSSEEGF